MGRVDDLRSEMAAAMVEAEAQEEYETLTEQFRATPTPELGEQRKRAAERLQQARAGLRANRTTTSEGEGDVTIAPDAIAVTTTVKEA